MYFLFVFRVCFVEKKKEKKKKKKKVHIGTCLGIENVRVIGKL
jgi:hypothetical protein